MTAAALPIATLLAAARADGLSLAVTPERRLKVRGARARVEAWQPRLAEVRDAIVAVLEQEAAPSRPAPSEWRERFLAISEGPIPFGYTPSRWAGVLAGAEHFMRDWGGRAAAMGWTFDELFSMHPTHPAARYDHMGLAWLLDRSEVIALSDDRAIIRTDNGARQRYLRPGRAPHAS